MSKELREAIVKALRDTDIDVEREANGHLIATGMPADFARFRGVPLDEVERTIRMHLIDLRETNEDEFPLTWWQVDAITAGIMRRLRGGESSNG